MRANIIGNDNGEKSFVVRVDGYIEAKGLQEHDERVHEHVDDTNKAVENDAEVLSFASARFVCCPEQSVQRVLAEC